MVYTRQEHFQFLEEELRAQTVAYKQKLDTSAEFLLMEREEVFVAQFLKFQDGEMILKFSSKRGLPRQGEYLYCFTLPKDLRDYRNWGNRTYGDLIKAKTNFSELVCIWQAPANEKDFSIAGFRGVEVDFASQIQDGEGMILVLGPNKPPFEYLANLQKIVLNQTRRSVNVILDQDFKYVNWKPALLDDKSNVSDFLLAQLDLQDTLVVQGPPGTGKTFLIAEICQKLCGAGKSVLVTALTNRALIEIIEKPALENLLRSHQIFKTKLSVDEARNHKDLQQTKEVIPQRGKLTLSTFYITSGEAANLAHDAPFDFVIVDEASQALLAMFAAAKILGKRNIWVGDIRQLPPVVALSDDKVKRKSYGALIDGLRATSENASLPIFQLGLTYRLTERAAKYTGIFYSDSLQSKSKTNHHFILEGIKTHRKEYYHLNGGPTLLKGGFPAGDFKPKQALALATTLVRDLLSINQSLHISVLSYFIETTKALQRQIFQTLGYHKNLLVETVSRVQGLTTDVCIFVIPNSSYHRSLEKRLFNVATSRSRHSTIIIIDHSVFKRLDTEDEVERYLKTLEAEFSFDVRGTVDQ